MGFFDFLPRWTAIECKAPGESFGIGALMHFIGKIYLGLGAHWKEVRSDRHAAGVVLAARITRDVRRWPAAPEVVRPGIVWKRL